MRGIILGGGGRMSKGVGMMRRVMGVILSFWGDGLVEGGIRFYGRMIFFDGRRVSGRNEMRSDVSVYDMRDEWVERVL